MSGRNSSSSLASPDHKTRIDDAGRLEVPASCDLLNSGFERCGDNLAIVREDAPALVILDYFTAKIPADLVTEGGGVVKGRTVEALTRSIVEQGKSISESEGTQIGHIESLKGSVTIIRADGTRIEAVENTALFEGDVIETGVDAAVGFRFVDGMKMSLGANARMVLEDFRYDPITGDGGGLIEVVQGFFSFISGKAAKAGLDALVIETPTMDIGVRGTKVVAHASAEGEMTTVTLLPEDDGTIGKIMIKTDAGEELLDQPFMSTVVTSRFVRPLVPTFAEPETVLKTYGETLQFLPFGNERDDIEQPLDSKIRDARPGNPDDRGDTDWIDFGRSEGVIDASPIGSEPTSVHEDAEAGALAAGNSVSEISSEPASVTEAEPLEAASGSTDESQATNDAADNDIDWTAIEPPASEEPVDAAPQIVLPIANTNTNQDAAFVLDVSTTFADPEGEAVTLVASQSGGAPLPAWLSFDPATGVLSGTPDNNDVGSLLLNVTATDPDGLSNSAAFQLTVVNTNDAPTVSVAIADTGATQDVAFAYDVLSSFADIDIAHGDSLTFSATQVGGAPLPVWLSIDPATGILSGTPTNGDVGSLGVEVTATDAGGLNVSDQFQLIVTNVNDRPLVTVAVADTTTNEDAAFNYDAGASFLDVDGDILTFSATQVGGAPLPGWLTINPANGVLSGTPTQGDVGSLMIDVTATDPGGLSNSSAFQLTIANTNDAPTVSVAVADTGATQDVAFAYDVSSSFADIDIAHGDSLTFSATQVGGAPLPAWLSIDPATGILSGTPTNGDVGTLDVEVTVTDSHGLNAVDAFQLTVTDVNDAPVVSVNVADTGASEDAAFNYDVSSNFSDPEGGSLTYSATQVGGTPLPAWLSIDSATGVLSGTPTQADVGPINIEVVATDGGGLSVADTFQLTVSNTNDAPTVSLAIADTGASEDATFNYDVTGSFADADIAHGDSLTFSATQVGGAPLPAWLTIDPATGVLSGTPAHGDVGVLDIEVTATDGSSATVTDAFQLTVSNTNDAPTVSVAIGDTGALEDAAFNYDVSSNFSDIDIPHGDSLTFSAKQVGGAPLPAWITIDPATGILSGTPSNGDVGSLNIEVTATDGSGFSVSDSFLLDIANTNDGPVVSVAFADATPPQDTLYTLNTANHFADDDSIHGDTLTFSAQQVGGAPLPAWLSIDPASGVLSGTPAAGDVGIPVNVEVTATDGSAASATATFLLTVSNVNDAPVVSAAIADNTAAEGTAFNYDVSANLTDPDGDTLTFSAQQVGGAPLPGWLSIDPATGVLSGTPSQADIGVLDIEVTATDPSLLSATSTFQLTISNTNDAPTVSVAIADANVNEDAAYNYDVSTHFADLDTPLGDTLTFSAKLSGGAPLPGWLSIDPATGILSGTPSNDDVGAVDIEVTATDSGGLNVTDTFRLTVDNQNDTPTVTSIANTSTDEDAAFAYDVSGSFDDVDIPHGDSLVFSATLSGGAPLPAWLSIDAATGVLSGTPANGDVGTIDVEVTATDGSAQSINATFQLTVANTNDAPIVSIAVADTGASEDAAFNYDISANFDDADLAYGDSLAFAATQVGGAPLPAWISIDAVTGILSGTPDNDAVGALDIEVTAKDDSGQTAVASFQLTVTNTNDAPVLSVTASPTLTSINEGETGGAGNTIAEIVVDGSIKDVDGTAVEAIAITGVDAANGVWQYSLNGGGNWSAVGSVSDSAALLLDATARVRFIPNADYVGDATLTFRAWDQSSGATGDSGVDVTTNGAGTPFSADADTASVTVVEMEGDVDLSSGTEFSINSASDDQQDTEIAALTDGGYVVVWQSEGGAQNNGKDIWFQIYDSAGDPTGSATRANSNTNDAQRDPVVTSLDGGGFVIAWESKLQDGDGYGVYAQRFDAIGNPLGSDIQVNEETASDQKNPEILGLNDGGFVVVWQSRYQDGDDSGVYARRFDASGNPATAEFAVNNTTANKQKMPAVAELNDGTLVFTWQNLSDGTEKNDIMLRRFATDGTPVSNESLVNSYTSDAQKDPDIATLTGGGFVIVWMSMDQDGDREGIYLQRYDAAGSKVEFELQVNTMTANSQENPRVIALNDGGFIVAWESEAQDSDGSSGIYGQRFDADGDRIGGEVKLSATITGDQTLPTLAQLSDGQVVVAWQTDESGNLDIVGQRFDAAPTGANSAPTFGMQGALDFGGGNSYVDAGDPGSSSNALDPGTGDLSVEAWFYYTGDNGLRSIVSKGNLSEYDEGYGIALDGDDLVVRLSDGGIETAASSLSMAAKPHGWYHVAMVIDQDWGISQSNITGYLNGSNADWTPGYGAVSNATFTQWGLGLNNSDSFLIGAGVGDFDAEIADVRVWGKALTENEINDAMARVMVDDEPGLIAQWFLDEGTGITANDGTGGYDGTLVNNPTWQNGIAVSTLQDTTLAGRVDASDADSDTVTFNVNGAASNGSASIDADSGAWVYDPNPGYTGADSFSLQANDGHGGTDTITINVTVSP